MLEGQVMSGIRPAFLHETMVVPNRPGRQAVSFLLKIRTPAAENQQPMNDFQSMQGKDEDLE